MLRAAFLLCLLALPAMADDLPCGIYPRADRIERGERGYVRLGRLDADQKCVPESGTPGSVVSEADGRTRPIITIGGRQFFTDEMISFYNPRAKLFPEN